MSTAYLDHNIASEQPDDRAEKADRRASALFVHLALIGCLCLQRFCLYVGGSPVFVCLPIFLMLVAWMVITGRARLRPLSLSLYVGFAVIAVAGTLIAVNTPDARINGLSVASLFSILVLYAGLAIGPGGRFDGSRTLGIFVFYVRLCAILGIVQYLAQFVGIRLFSFLVALPALRPILVEPLFNYLPVVAYGSPLFRSNGFFLVEPSIFSQLLMLGVAVDFFVRREWRYLPLYGTAYLFTYAGTGLLAFIIACALAVILSPRGSLRIAAFGLLALVFAAAGTLAYPELFASLGGRASELNYSGSSGYARYMTQFDILSKFSGETRTLLGYGPGALERATFYVPGGANPALKLFVDYGFAGMLSFIAFFIASLWRRDIALVSLYLLINFQLGGGYLLFMPFVVLAAILCVWSSRITPGAGPDILQRSGDR